MNELDQVLNRGLEKGYAGSAERKIVQRGPFEGESIEFTFEDGGKYIDEWFADRLGGGQEIVGKDGKRSTRLHAGGTVSIEKLNELGITKKSVIDYLKRKNSKLVGQTRLGTDCLPDPDGDWQYGYSIIKQVPEINLNIGLERIDYKGQLVFAHGFLHSPVE